MATEVQGWQLDRVRAAMGEIADYFPEGYNDREIRAMAERALAAADEAVAMIPVESLNVQAGVRAQLEVERLRAAFQRVIENSDGRGNVLDDDLMTMDVREFARRAQTSPAESSMPDE
jgi:hypothetical protein